MPPVTTLVYTSRASRPMGGGDLTELLSIARARNTAAGVTGMLVYAEGTFMQQLEGEAAAVDAIYESIRGDARHHAIRQLARRRSDVRRYEDWAMGFSSLDADALVQHLPGYRASADFALVSSELITRSEIAESLLGVAAGLGRGY